MAEPVVRLDDADRPGGFDEPWEATVFALAVSLNARDLLSWNEWTQLVARVAREAPEGGQSTYLAWLRALETFVVSAGLTDERALAEKKAAWDKAARTTPHGMPVELP